MEYTEATLDKMKVALTRPVPASLAQCQLTHLERVPIDVVRAAAEHRDYENALRALGCTVRHVPAADDLPDSVFVEDVALVLDELAIVTRPGAESRRAERASVAAVLSEYRPIQSIAAPGTLDGGDVLRLGRTLYVGLSSRTNEDGAHQLAQLTKPFGYEVVSVRMDECLHLKSAASAIGGDCVLVNPKWIDTSLLRGSRGSRDSRELDVIEIDPSEPHAANVLRIGHTIICAAAHERTAAGLRGHGYDVCPVGVSELAKAEAGVTCCSVIIEC
jgi:dimethylargininase